MRPSCNPSSGGLATAAPTSDGCAAAGEPLTAAASTCAASSGDSISSQSVQRQFELVVAASDGNAADVRRMIESGLPGHSVEATDEDGSTPLIAGEWWSTSFCAG